MREEEALCLRALVLAGPAEQDLRQQEDFRAVTLGV